MSNSTPIRVKPSSLAHALSEFAKPELEQLVRDAGLPGYRARQIARALDVEGAQSFSDVTVLPLQLRQELAGRFVLRTTEAVTHLHSATDQSEKVLFRLRDDATVETVLIRSGGGQRRERYTVCVSSQVGCPAACTFCATGLAGFMRNLSPAEISDQVMYFVYQLRREGKSVSTVVFMGMGEPFLNTRSVQTAVGRLTDPVGLNLGQRHITVSTVGIVPQVKKFADWAGQVNLAISLHAPNDSLRSTLVPYNQHFPLTDLLLAVSEYVERTNRRVSFEYVLLRGVNDGAPCADELAQLLRPFGGLAHVNVIPWNPFREGRFIRSEGPDADAFVVALSAQGINATIRYSKGLDISAACGQLREQVGMQTESGLDLLQGAQAASTDIR